MTKKAYIIIALCAAVLGFLSYTIYNKYRNRDWIPDTIPPAILGSPSKLPLKESTKEQTKVGNVRIQTSGNTGYTIEEVPLSAGSLASHLAPSLDWPMTIPKTFSPEAGKIITEKIEKTSAELKKNPRLVNEWLNLAIYRKMINDYEGARDIWEFLVAVNPKDVVSYSNLGSLYAFFLKNPQKAEENFMKAVNAGSGDVSLYRNFYEFYRYVMKDDVRAKQILRDAIERMSGTAGDFHYLLDHY